MRRPAVLVSLLIVPALGSPQGPSFEPEIPFVPGKRWAIVVGAGAYEHYSKLDFASSDARDFAALLLRHYSFREDTVRLLTDESGPRLTPTAGHILGEIESILSDRRLDKSDLFIFFFSGHGVATTRGDFLLPTDARKESVERVGLPVAELIKRFSEAGLKNVLIIADACRSGERNQFGKQLARLGGETNIAVLLGCEPGKRSYEDSRLGRGVFTHFLLEALEKKDLRREVSGALWASDVAKYVHDAAQEYTERDYGDDAQAPLMWTDERQDVLLGAYLPEQLRQETLRQFIAEASALAPSFFGAALTALGEELYGRDDLDESIEVLKTAERFTDLSQRAAYVLGNALRERGRLTEATDALRTALSGPNGTTWYHLAGLSDGILRKSWEPVLASARGLWQLEKSVETGFLLSLVLRTTADHDAQLAVLSELAAISRGNQRMEKYVQGETALTQGRFREAAAAYRAAMASPGSVPGYELFVYRLVEALAAQSNYHEALSAIDDALSGQSNSGRLHLWKAGLLNLTQDRPKSLDALGDALESGNLRDYELLYVVTIAGSSVSDLAERLISAAAKYSDSWRAQVAAGFAAAVSGIEVPDWTDELYAEKNPPYQTWVELAKCALAFIGDASARPEADKTDVVTYCRQITTYCLQRLMLRAEDLQGDNEAWGYIINMGVNKGRHLELEHLIKKHGAASPKSPFMREFLGFSLLLHYMDTAQDAEIERLRTRSLSPAEFGSGARRLYALYLTLQGHADQAGTLLQDLNAVKKTPGERSGIIGDQALFEPWTRILIDAKSGRRTEATDRLNSMPDSRPVEMVLAGLAWHALGDDARALPLLSASWKRAPLGFLLFEAGMSLVQIYRDDGRDEDADRVVWELAKAAPGNPYINNLAYGRDADVDRFAGAYLFQVVTNDGESGDLELTINADGSVVGFFERDDGVISAVKGQIDRYGNLTGTVRASGKSLALYAKLAPADLSGGLEFLKEEEQRMHLVDESGVRTIWRLRLPAGIALLSDDSESAAPDRRYSQRCDFAGIH
ncbi:MAG: caspase family protein [Armatimonadetes bacterium]|nr:caspase family protein [Armatimonadota bacterium]